MLLLGEQVLTILWCISLNFLICNYVIYDVQNATYLVTGPLVPHDICSHG